MKILIRIFLVLTAASLFLSACGPGISASATSSPTPEPPVPPTAEPPSLPTELPSALGEYMLPAYYPETYLSIVDGSKSEVGLTIYSNLSEASWDSAVSIFNSHYPWIKVTILDLGSSAGFERYKTEIAENQPTADLIASADPVGWLQFFESRSVLTYTSPEDLLIPNLAKSVYGTYAISSEPLVIIYNKKLVPTPPKNMVELAQDVKNNPEADQSQIATVDAELNGAGFAINWFWTDQKTTLGWDSLETIGAAQPLLLASDQEVVQAVGQGQAKIGYFVATSAVIPQLETYPDLGWAYMNDIQPILINSIAITEKAASPNSAKLMVDFILSQEGQYTLALGGLTPFRSDISGITQYHLDKILSTLGDSNVLLFSFDTRLNNQTLIAEFLEKWKTAVRKENPAAPTAQPAN